MKTILRAEKISKSYFSASEEIKILNQANLEIKEQEKIGVIGYSGCGKTTLLQILGLIDNPDDGSIIFRDKNLSVLSVKEKNKILINEISFIYQFHHLMMDFSVIENVMLPMLIKGFSRQEAINIAESFLINMGLKDKINKRPSLLSGGEQQRVAIARALAKKPSIILADEPTGNLDPKTSHMVFDVMIQNINKSSASLLCVTHNKEISNKLDSVLSIKNGKIIQYS